MTSMTLTQHRFRTMGSFGHVIVAGGPPGLVEHAQAMLGTLEQRWSRFIETSDVSRINAGAGTPVMVAAETLTLVGRMVQAWALTGGRFDPTVGVRRIGYERPFAEGLDRLGTIEPVPGDGCAEVGVDWETGSVMIPANVQIDPGGLGKGLAADLVAESLLHAGADGALVNVGGDMKVVGTGPEDGGWRVDVAEETVARGVLGSVLLPGGSALATSTPLRRRWRVGDTEVHHLIDPVTGLPYESMAKLISVIAADAWWAEASTKQIAGVPVEEAAGLLTEAAALVVDRGNSIHMLNDWERYAA
jgi:FAD:protein FMN transferase